MAPQLSFTLGAILGILTLLNGSSAEPVFVTQALESTFGVLGSRQCLPADFDPSETVPLAKAAGGFVSDPTNVPAECAGAPILALFYNRFATINGLLSADAASFSVDGLEAVMNSYSTDTRYRGVIRDIMNRCRERTPAGLSGRQLAVYSYGCLKWSLFSDCDIQQTERGALDESGLLRRALFLTGSCPTSLDTLQEALQQATGRSVAECRQGLYSGDDAQQLYDAGVSLVTCLLQDFTGADGVVDLAKLRSAITSGDLDTVKLTKVVNDCARVGGPVRFGQVKKMTAEEFAQCWATSGVFTCAYQEATQVSTAFPNNCAMPLTN